MIQNRLVTLTGAGGVGKTRMAIQIAGQLSGEFADGVWYVDLAPITDPDLVPITTARACGLPDQPGRSTMDTLRRFAADRQLLVILDNCEHLLDASAAMALSLLESAPRLTLLTTSREPIGIAGELSWRVPSLPLADKAIELFFDRARRARPDFVVSDDNAATVTEICRRLDGVPLAIELAAARVRALSLAEILESLHDRFRLLTGGARTAVRRQQTLRASVDWSHALLTEPERVLFRRLAAFMGGFDLDGAQSVCGGGDVERYQVLDQLALLVDKSLVVADDSWGRTRYRLLETVRQYALEKLGESGEADVVRSRHRDHYTALVAAVDAPAGKDHEQLLEQAETEIDNLRGAFAWSPKTPTPSLPSRWRRRCSRCGWRGRGPWKGWPGSTSPSLTTSQSAEMAATVRARSLADRAVLATTVGAIGGMDQAEQALALARDIDDPALRARALMACGFTAAYNAELAGAYFAEAIELAREVHDTWRLSQILTLQASAAIAAGDPIAARVAAEEGRDLADEIGDRFNSRHCRMCLGLAQVVQGEVARAIAQFHAVAAEAEAEHDGLHEAFSRAHQASALARQGDTGAARSVIEASIESACEFGGLAASVSYFAVANTALAEGDVAAAQAAAASTWEHGSVLPGYAAHLRPIIAQAALACGDLIAARRWADDAVATATGHVLMQALSARARVAIAQGEREQAERDAHGALALAAEIKAYLFVPDPVECLASLAGEADSHREAVRLFAAAEGMRRGIGAVRFKVYDASYESSVKTLRDAMAEKDFDSAWDEGAALSIEEAIAYAQRGRGQRKRPTSGWASLTPAELDVVRLVSEGLSNNDVATRLFVSPRTVQTHLTHVYTKLNLNSRVQLVQEAARHTSG